MHKGRILLSFFTATFFLIISLLIWGKTYYTSPPKTAQASTYYSIITPKRTTTIPTRIIRFPTSIESRPKNSPSITLGASPTPTPTPIKSGPTPTITTSVTDYLLDQVNAYRKTQGLSSVSSNSETCAFAETRVKEIASSFNHDGFTNRINSHTLPYPGYHEVTENIAMNSNYRDVVSSWIKSLGHAANMRADTPYVCIAQSGNYYAYEGWRP